MTTSSSPHHEIAAQAKKIAQALKDYKWADGTVMLKFGIVQDDKIIAVTLTREVIERESIEALQEMFISHMKGETVQ